MCCFDSEDPKGYLDYSLWKYPVIISVPGGFSYRYKAVIHHEFPEIKEDDWIVVTGKFERVTLSGIIVLSPIRVKNEGARALGKSLFIVSQ